MDKIKMTVNEMARLGGLARQSSLSTAQRQRLGRMGSDVTNKLLSASQRSANARKAGLASARNRKARKETRQLANALPVNSVDANGQILPSEIITQ